jgi:RNA polymerase sigma-70 factor (ECF subfamily)
MARAAAGDRAAFAAVVERHRGAVFRLARVVTGDDTAAEDVLQETFLAALRGAAGYRGDAPVTSWLYAIARHAARRLARRADQVPSEPRTIEALGAAAGWGRPDVEVMLAAAEDRASLEAALAALNLEDREVIALRDLEGESGDDTARTLGLTVAAMKSRLHRARLHLAAELRRRGGTDDARS